MEMFKLGKERFLTLEFVAVPNLNVQIEYSRSTWIVS